MSAVYMRRCAGKERHDTKQAAISNRGALKGSKSFRTVKVDVYRCDQCLGWHIGGGGKKWVSRERYRGRRGVKRANRRMRGRI